jgi:hypothetical protein
MHAIFPLALFLAAQLSTGPLSGRTEATGSTKVPEGLGPAADASPPVTATKPDRPKGEPAELPRSRATPPEMVAEAIMLPAGSSVTGRRFTLLEAISTTVDRRRQAEITHAYWRLAEAVAEYHFAFEENAVVSGFAVRPEDTAMLKTAQASAAAALETAELLVVEAQSRLAEAAFLPSTHPLPVPADPPHVGPYRTHFDALFAMQHPPAQMRLIDRTLPLRRRAIDARAAAVHAADDALEAVTDAYHQGQLSFSTVLSAMGQLGRQRRAMIASVCQYNHDIADYALSVVAPGTTGPALVAMLIRPSNGSRQPAHNDSSGVMPLKPLPQVDKDVQPAGHMVPEETSSSASSSTPEPTPTLAPPRPKPEPPASQEPTLAPLRDSAQPSEAEEPAPTTRAKLPDLPDRSQPEPDRGAPSQPAEPIPTPPSEPAGGDQSAEPPRTAVPLSSLPPVTSRSSMRPTIDGQVAAATTALYPALVELDPAVRAKQLAVALHRPPSTAEPSAEPITLPDCLRSAPIGRRLQAVAAYWHVRQKVAELQVFQQTAEMLDELSLVALDRREAPAGAAAMLQIRACKAASEAERLRCQVELLAAEFELTETLGRPLDGNWLSATTAPHSGPYLLKLDAQPQHLVTSWPVQRLAHAVPTLADSLQQRAAAVVQADAVRAAFADGYRNGARSVDEALMCIQQQTDQTLAFLETLTAYNEAIAEYALAVIPATAPADLVAQTLVVLEPDE